MPIVSISEWETYVSRQNRTHILQTAKWGELKSAFGWRAIHLVQDEAGVQLLLRKLPFGFSLAYIPKGPVSGSLGQLLPELDQVCRTQRTIFLIVEPDELSHVTPETIVPPGFTQGKHFIQPRRTLIVDICGDEEQILSRMKQKTRYNIRLAQKKGVTVRAESDIQVFYALMQVTGDRDNFGVHSSNYYRRAYDLFHPGCNCELLIAEFEGKPIAALMVFAHQGRAWYFYGASADTHRNLMATYLLQWEAILWARERGCKEYDLWGVPDEEEQVLEANFTERADGLWGVYRFKRGFGGELRKAAGPWERVYIPWLYRMYRWWAGRRSGGEYE